MVAFVFLLTSIISLAKGLFGTDRTRVGRAWLGVLGLLSAALTLVLILYAGRATQTLGLLVMPAGLLWLTWAGLAAVLTAKRRTIPAAALWSVWVAYTLIGNATFGGLLLQTTERQYAHIDPFDATYDAVVVLGGGTATRGEYDFLAGSGDRVALGARLWHSGNTPILVTTGSAPSASDSAHNSAQVTTQIWTSLGIPTDRILTISQPTNTREELRVIRTLMQTHPWTRVGVVSSARHLPRVMRNAERQSIDVLPLPADFRATAIPHPFHPRAAIPSGRGFALVHTFAWEWLARTVGH